MQQSAAGWKFEFGLREMQLFSPHMRSFKHWSSLSQSPSSSSQGSLSVQQDQVSASLVPLQSHVVALMQQSAIAGKFVLLWKSLQLFSPHRSSSLHSSLLSQSPSASLHLFVTEQHDHVFWSNVPLQSQVTSASKRVVRKLNELFVVKKILILMVSFVCYLAYWVFDFALNLGTKL